MKNLGKLSLTLFLVMTLLSSCKIDADTDNNNNGMFDATYEITVDTLNSKSGTVRYASHEFVNELDLLIINESDSISKNNDHFSLILKGYPKNIGDTASFKKKNAGLVITNVIVNGEKQTLTATDGTMERETKTKISFNISTSDKHSVKGYVESAATK